MIFYESKNFLAGFEPSYFPGYALVVMHDPYEVFLLHSLFNSLSYTCSFLCSIPVNGQIEVSNSF